MLQSAIPFLHELLIINLLQRSLVRPFGQNFNLFVSKLTMVLAIIITGNNCTYYRVNIHFFVHVFSYLQYTQWFLIQRLS